MRLNKNNDAGAEEEIQKGKEGQKKKRHFLGQPCAGLLWSV